MDVSPEQLEVVGIEVFSSCREGVIVSSPALGRTKKKLVQRCFSKRTHSTTGWAASAWLHGAAIGDSWLDPYNKPVCAAASLDVLNAQIVACEACPRLREYCAGIARDRKKQWRDWSYWGRPVPSFGDPRARVLVFGLAPGAHGSNRTGRPFTGDGSGNFMFPVLYEAGFASQPESTSRDDGMKLKDMWISASVRCAPPGNKPLPEEQRNCAHWLDEEMTLLPRLKVVVCLGKIGFDAFVAYLVRSGVVASRAGIEFRHGAEYKLPNGMHLLGTYHPSLQNTNTGKLTKEMFFKTFARARALLEA